MLEIPQKTYFPPLPFEHDLPYFQIQINKPIKNEFLNIYPFSPINMSSSETETEEKNNNLFINTNLNNTKRKSPVVLNSSATNFKFAFYQLFTSKKKFPKKFVVLIHNEICSKIGLRRITRDEGRSIDLYFLNFSKYQDQIISCIQHNKKELIRFIPEIKNILN